MADGLIKQGKIYHVRYTDPGTGKRRKKTTGCTDRDAARRWVDENIGPVLRSQGQVHALQEQLAVAKGIAGRNLEEAWDVFVRRPSKISEGRLQQIRGRWESVVEWLVAEGAPTLGKITEDVAAAWWYHLDASDYSSNVRNDMLQICRKVMGASKVDAFDELPSWGQKREDRGQQPFTADHLDQFKANPHGAFGLIMLGVNTGLSLVDAVNLRWSSVDFAGGFIRVNRSKTGQRCTVPILPWLAEWLKDVEVGSDYVFPDWQQQYEHNRMSVSRAIQSYLTECGLETTEPGELRARTVYGYHSCRHTFAWMAEANGVPLSVIQAMIGHVSPEMTQRYTEHATEAQIASYMMPVASEDHQAKFNQLFDMVAGYARAKGLLGGGMNFVLSQQRERDLVSYLKERI